MTTVQIHHRDYAAEMRRYIDEFTSVEVSYNASEVADKIVAELLGSDRELLYGWLQAHAAGTIRAAIAARDASSRAYARHQKPSSVFHEAAKQAESGNTTALRAGFLQAIYVVDGDNTRKQMRDMTASDVMYVAAGYEDRARSSLMEAAFLRAVAKKVGDGLVGDTFTNVQLAELRQRITGK